MAPAKVLLQRTPLPSGSVLMLSLTYCCSSGSGPQERTPPHSPAGSHSLSPTKFSPHGSTQFGPGATVWSEPTPGSGEVKNFHNLPAEEISEGSFGAWLQKPSGGQSLECSLKGTNVFTDPYHRSPHPMDPLAHPPFFVGILSPIQVQTFPEKAQAPG